jgi:FixJ family two-component response regulator
MTQSKETVYLVDDDPRVRGAIAALLHSFGIAVISFDSAASYLASTRSDDAACLVLDLRLPQMSGLELQERLGSDAVPPIIFISGRGDIPSTVRAMKSGAIEFLTKPLDPQALLAAVRSAFALDRKQRESRATRVQLESRLAQLSPREREVLPLVIAGLLNKQSAAILHIAEITLQIHRTQIMRKMAANSLPELVRMTEALGIHPAESQGSRPPHPLRGANTGSPPSGSDPSDV